MRQHQNRPSATPAKSPEPTQSAQSLGDDFEFGGEQLPGSRAPMSPRTILQLQRTAGNHAVEQYVVSGLINRAANDDAEEIRKINERIRRLNEGRTGNIQVGPDGRLRQPSQIPPRQGPKITGPGPEGNAVSVESKAGSMAGDSLQLGKTGAAEAGGFMEERTLLRTRFYDMIRNAGERIQQREIRAKIASILAEKGITMAGREGAVVVTSEAPPLAVIVQTVVAIQDIFTFGEVVWEIAKILAG